MERVDDILLMMFVCGLRLVLVTTCLRCYLKVYKFWMSLKMIFLSKNAHPPDRVSNNYGICISTMYLEGANAVD